MIEWILIPGAIALIWLLGIGPTYYGMNNQDTVTGLTDNGLTVFSFWWPIMIPLVSGILAFAWVCDRLDWAIEGFKNMPEFLGHKTEELHTKVKEFKEVRKTRKMNTAGALRIVSEDAEGGLSMVSDKQ